MGAARRTAPAHGDVPRSIGTASPPAAPLLCVDRPRLQAFFDQVPLTPISVVVAPAGSGKTAAAAIWAERARGAGHEVSWLRPDQSAELAAHLARTQAHPPSVVVLDNAHLLDPESVGLLASVLTRDAEAVRVLLLS